MPRIDNEKFYTSAIELYGTTAKGVNWNSKSSQTLRFDAILKMLPEDLSQFSLVDAGCGFGDLYLYMYKKKKLPKQYIGIDKVADMYSIASKKTGCEIINADICKDNIPTASFFTCSGAMNILHSFETELFIRRCYESSEIGFIFNILHGDKESDTYNYLTTKDIYAIAKTLHVQRVELNSEYLEDDITVGFFK